MINEQLTAKIGPQNQLKLRGKHKQPRRINGVDIAYKSLMLEMVKLATDDINKGEPGHCQTAYHFLTKGLGKTIIDTFDIKPLISKICPKLSIYEHNKGIES
jgi:hypothetical protein